MSTNLNKAVNLDGKRINRKIKQTVKRTIKRTLNGNRRNVRRRLNQRRIRNRIPMATAPSFNRTMASVNINSTTARVSGSDLVYKIPDQLPMTTSASVLAVIPSNPAYWLGTKISQVAKGYQNYRPVKFDVHYVPHCAATQQGNVIAGTIFHEAPSVDNLQQSLRSSNGGIMTQVFKPAVSHVKVGSNLQKNLYRVGGDIDDDSMPFYFIAIAVACTDNENHRINPGYFYVNYTYTFKNPIGGGVEFANSGLSLFNDQLSTMKKNNVKVILCQNFEANSMTLGIGTALDAEYSTDLSAWKFYYNQTEVNSPNTYLWVFSNQQSGALNNDQMRELTKTPILYTHKGTIAPETTVEIPAQKGLLFDIGTGVYNTFINQTPNRAIEVTIPDQADAYMIEDINQVFGAYQYLVNLLAYYQANPLDFYLKSAGVTKGKFFKMYKVQNPEKSTILDLTNKINKLRVIDEEDEKDLKD